MDMQSSSVETWPADAVPQSWVNALFTKMARMWGNTFLDKWRDGDLDGVKIEWGKGLRKLSSTELKSGVDALLTLKFPPSLPEFYGLCKQMRLHEMPAAPALSDQTKADPRVVEANLARMREAMAPLLVPREPSARWAYDLLMRGESKYLGKPLTYETIRCASDAITSGAGRKVVEDCIDEFERENLRTIRDAIVEGRRSAFQPLWDTP